MGRLRHLNGQCKSLQEQAGCGGKVGRKSGGGTGPPPMRHGWGRGRVPMIRRGHSQCGSQWGQEETFRESDGNVASISPTYLGPGEPAGARSLTTVLWGAPLAVGTMEAWEWGNGGGKVDTRWNWHPWRVLGEGEGFPCSEGPIHGAGISRDGEKPLGDWKGTELVTSPPAQAPASLLATSFSFFLIYFIFLTLFYFFILHYCSLSSLLPFFLCWRHGLQGLSSQAGGWTWAPVVGEPSPNYWTNRKPQTTGVISVSAPRGPHLCTKTHFHPTSY